MNLSGGTKNQRRLYAQQTLMEDAKPKLTPGMFTSRTEEWATPAYVFNALDAEFHFTLDVCATRENAKCDTYFDKASNGLSQSWGGICFMNPPYGKEIGKWMEKAYREAQKGAVVVCLIPARPDTRWWHDWVMKAQEIRFVRGRLKFVGGKYPAPFPSCVIIFLDSPQTQPKLSSMRFKRDHSSV